MAEANGLIVRCEGKQAQPRNSDHGWTRKTFPTHFDAMNDRCFGIRSSGGSPDSANVVRFIAARTDSHQHDSRRRARQIVLRLFALTQGKLGVVGKVDVSGRGRSARYLCRFVRISDCSHRVVEREVHVVVEARVGSGVELGEASYDKPSAPQRIKPSL
jgi:hypothetical protein